VRMIVGYTKPARVRFAPARHLLAHSPHREHHRPRRTWARYVCDAHRVQWGLSCGRVARNQSVRSIDPSALLNPHQLALESRTHGALRDMASPRVSPHTVPALGAGEEREARVGLQRALSSRGGGDPFEDLRSSRAPFFRNIALSDPHPQWR